MALVIAYDDAKANQFKRKNPKYGGFRTPFFGSADNPDLPHATLNQHDPGGFFSGTHFHRLDQFQVFIEGKCKVGKHDLTPYCVHFSRAYTPYGPLVSDAADTFTFFVMRAYYDQGSQHLPEELEQLRQVPNRRPWQISRRVSFPAFQSDTAAADIMLQPIPDMKDERGLAVYTLSMTPNAQAQAPDPSHGDGQYLAVLKGSLLHDNKEHKAPALVFVYPKENAFHVHAGAEGLEALVLNFPQPQTPIARAATAVQTTTALKRWQCSLCSFVYDETAGMPEEGIAPGTRWQDVPENWSCPDCSSSKADFQMVELKD